jgi:hypothetical protein
MQTGNPSQFTIQPPTPLNHEAILKIQFLQKFLKDAEMLLEGNPMNESGICRMKLAEAVFWGNAAIMGYAANPKTQPPQQQITPPAPTELPKQQEPTPPLGEQKIASNE